LLDGLTYSKVVGDDILTMVDQWIVKIPAEFRRARVLVANNDSSYDVVSRTTIAKVTDLA
jgi:hypothetical protein